MVWPSINATRLNRLISLFFFYNTATTEIYTLSLHDALPISIRPVRRCTFLLSGARPKSWRHARSEEHTSELQSPVHLVCRLLLEKKKPQAACRLPYGCKTD